MKYAPLPLLFTALAAPALAETENRQICEQLSGKPGLYLVRSTRDIDRLPVRGKLAFQNDIRIYVIPPQAEEGEEQVVHVRATTTARDARNNSASAVRLKRNKIASDCFQSLLRKSKRDFGNDTETDDVPPSEYNDFASKTSRKNRRLDDWHFFWNVGRKSRNCQYTADHTPPIDGLVDKPKPVPLARIASIGEGRATEKVKGDAASVTAVLVHQQKSSKACFAFRLFRDRDASWAPQTTTIISWVFDETPGKPATASYKLHWTQDQ
jgi:hypothetical protein